MRVLSGEKSFFSPLFTAALTLFWPNLDPVFKSVAEAGFIILFWNFVCYIFDQDIVKIVLVTKIEINRIFLKGYKLESQRAQGHEGKILINGVHTRNHYTIHNTIYSAVTAYSTYYVLHLSDEFMVAYWCQANRINKLELAWVLSRDRSPDFSEVESLEKILADNGIHLDMVTVRQDKCTQMFSI